MDNNSEINMVKKLNENNNKDNFIISPLAIEIILALCANGAEGKTQSEILKFLNYNNIKEANKTSKKIMENLHKNKDIISIANAVLTKTKSKEDFIIKAINEYDAKIEELINYEQVNTWVRKKTKNNITKIINSLTPNLFMILLNALYFEALWSIQFDQKDNEVIPFYNIDSPKGVGTMMMTLRGDLLNYYENKYLQAIKLNYVSKNNSINAIIILPKDHINTFINQLNNGIYKEIKEGLKKPKTKVNLFLPKFEVEYRINMGHILHDLGIREAFTNNAEFKGISDNEDLHIGEVLQKNYIIINEQGTKATSVTEMEIILESLKSKDPNAKDFIVNKPFLFLLVNEDFPIGHDILFFTKICNIEDYDDYN